MIATIPIGQAPQAIAYVVDAVPQGDGKQGLQPLGVAGEAIHLALAPVAGGKSGAMPTSVSLFDQGLTQVLQASVTGLEPRKPYVLALASQPDGKGKLEPLSSFMTNPAGSAIVNAVGPIRQVVQDAGDGQRRYLVIAAASTDGTASPVQVQVR